MIDESFYKSEIRDGYTITDTRKRIWARELEILIVFDDICRKNGIKYYMESGTLIGAVRHKGFIPWDDDIDVQMFRKDYELFRTYAKTELPDGWFLRNDRDSWECEGAIPCVVNSRTVRTDPEFLNRFHGCPYNVGVDICVLDTLPDNPEEMEVYRVLTANAYDIEENTPKNVTLGECGQELKNRIIRLTESCGVEIDPADAIKPQLNRLADQLPAMYYDYDGNDVAIAAFHLNAAIRTPRAAYAETEYLRLEHVLLPAPAGAVVEPARRPVRHGQRRGAKQVSGRRPLPRMLPCRV